MTKGQPRVWWFSKNHHHARFVYRFRTLAFHVSKTGSIPVPSTRFNCIGLPMPVGCMCIQPHCRVWVLHIPRNLEIVSGGRWTTLERNEVDDQSQDDYVVNPEWVLSNFPVQLNVVILAVQCRQNKRGDSPKGGMPTYHRQQWFV